MDNYHDVDEAVVIAENARLKMKNSFTVNIINALIYAQKVMADDYCIVFKVCSSVVKNDSFTMDMRPKAVEKIMEYINSYSKFCI